MPLALLLLCPLMRLVMMGRGGQQHGHAPKRRPQMPHEGEAGREDGGVVVASDRPLLRIAGLWLVIRGAADLLGGGVALRPLRRLLGLAQVWLGLRVLQVATVSVTELYHALAGLYDRIAFTWREKLYPEAHAALNQALAERLPSGGRVLDLGCGTGANLGTLLALGLPFSQYVGVDVSPDMLAQARRRFARVDNALWVQLDLTADSLPEGPFDLIVSTWVFEHLRDTRPVVDKAWSGLAPGGWMLLLFEVREGDLRSAFYDGLWRVASARLIPWGEVRRYPGSLQVQTWPGRWTPAAVLIALQRPASGET
ncbi:MAG: class I SAM-dependent methyltransferase [Anaerolineae bacterium]|nr:class I SAM-dependent methyltransferase [Anaerolineae bacterium]